MSVEAPSVLRYLAGVAVMLVGVILPITYAFVLKRRAPASFKQLRT